MAQEQVVVDCSVPGGAVSMPALTPAELVAYNTQQPIGQAAAAAKAATAALIEQHVQALAAQYAALTANPAGMQADILAFATICQALKNGVQPTTAQQLIIDRVLCRMIVILLGS
jgi:hypothetical protein